MFEENRVSDRKVVPFRKRPPSGVELDVYRRMTRNWSAELRRLNKVLGPYWAGFKSGLNFDHTRDMRVKMFAAFGSDAVLRAERAPCNCLAHQHGVTTGGWWCPLHGHQL